MINALTENVSSSCSSNFFSGGTASAGNLSSQQGWQWILAMSLSPESMHNAN